VIAAGLADPYLSHSLLQALVRIGHRDTRVFVTVPSRRWAIAERERLGVPIDRTRFRTTAGDEVFSRSVTLDAPELRDLFEQSGLRRVESGTIAAEDWIGDPQPEIAWAVGRPTLAPALRPRRAAVGGPGPASAASLWRLPQPAR
jgi:hypothetical protein